MLDEPTDKSNEQPPAIIVQSIVPQPINGQPSGLRLRKKCVTKIILRIGMLVAAVLIGSGLAAWIWYGVQLTPLTGDKEKLIAVTVESGSTPSQIGNLLQDKAIIRSSLAFDVNTRLSGTRSKLQAGTYRLSPGDSTPQIVKHLVSGKVDQFTITFLPGATLKQHVKVLLKAGFSQSEVDVALSQSYDSPLFEGKPAGTDLEGYIYGETYSFSSGSTAKAILQRTFDEFAQVIKDNNLVAGFKQQNLTLYQGITLASIVQRESISPKSGEPTTDQKQIAQVFYTRLNAGMPLGSDVTFIYAANKLGVTPISTLESPYNTRIITGLPPGPIASPGITALKATAAPALGDYVYFVAGDDGKTYFGRTLEEHEANVARYCTVECNKP
ncbi:endolytic transglycosylase MltG [Candidatus Saccharibacteria bacterium]|nr:endolytic transglycosylase MltG [Candidatus Saccharibacteria bacterium]